MSDPTNEERLAIARARIQAIDAAAAFLAHARLDVICEQEALRRLDVTQAEFWRNKTDLDVLAHDRALRPVSP